MNWANQMVNMDDRPQTSVTRVDFFRKVGERYDKVIMSRSIVYSRLDDVLQICDQIISTYGDSAEAASTPSVSQTADWQLARLSLSGKLNFQLYLRS